MSIRPNVRNKQALDIATTTRRLIKHFAFGPMFFQIFAAIYLALQPLPCSLLTLIFGACMGVSLVMGVKAYTARTGSQYYLSVGIVWLCTSFALLVTSLLLLMLHLFKYEVWSWILLSGYVANLVGVWRLYRPVWNQTFPANQKSGRFDLVGGTVCPIIPQATFHFQHPVLQRISMITAANGVIFALLGGNMGMRMNQSEFRYKELVFDLLIYLLAVLLLFEVASSFYTYTWIRRWEKSTGRTMWIKGFEPGVTSS